MTVSRTVVPGEWYGVLGDAVIVLLPPEAKARVAGLWEAVDEGAGFDEVLDALISGGLRSLPSFVLVSGEGRDVKVVIRGAGEAELTTADGPVTVSGSADTTWVERNVRRRDRGPWCGSPTATARRTPWGRGWCGSPASSIPLAPAARAPAEPTSRTVTQDAQAIAVPIEPRTRSPRARILPPDAGPPEAERAAARIRPRPIRAGGRAGGRRGRGRRAPSLVARATVVTTPPAAPVLGAPVRRAGAAPARVPFDPLTSPDLAVDPGARRRPRTPSGGRPAAGDGRAPAGREAGVPQRRDRRRRPAPSWSAARPSTAASAATSRPGW